MSGNANVLVEETWVSVTEGAEITNYQRDTLRKLVMRLAKQPEEEREIKIRKRSYGWEMWLPDLVAYSKKPRTKPLGKRNSTS
jgi:chromosome segregation and condensation protein ScpB